MILELNPLFMTSAFRLTPRDDGSGTRDEKEQEASSSLVALAVVRATVLLRGLLESLLSTVAVVVDVAGHNGEHSKRAEDRRSKARNRSTEAPRRSDAQQRSS